MGVGLRNTVPCSNCTVPEQNNDPELSMWPVTIHNEPAAVHKKL